MAKPKTYAPPRDDQRAVLVAYALQAGEDWKARLRADWMRGGSQVVDMEAYTLLHQLRNSHGPRWLSTYRVPT